MKNLRGLFWFGLISGGFLFIMSLVVFDAPPWTIPVSIVAVVAIWISAKQLLGWFFGLGRHIRAHLGLALHRAATLEHPIEPQIEDDLIRALVDLTRESGGRMFGRTVFFTNPLDGRKEPGAIEWRSTRIDQDRWDSIPNNGLFLVTVDGVPCVAEVSQNRDDYDFGDHVVSGRGTPGSRLVLRARDQSALIHCRDGLIGHARRMSAFRGATIAVCPREQHAVRFVSSSPRLSLFHASRSSCPMGCSTRSIEPPCGNSRLREHWPRRGCGRERPSCCMVRPEPARRC